MSNSLSLTEALDIFSDHLPEIKDVLALHILSLIASVPKPKSSDEDEEHYYYLPSEIRQDLYALEVKTIIEQPQRILKAVVNRLQAQLPTTSNKPGAITTADIEQAKLVPIEQLLTARIFKSSGKWIASTHCPLPDHAGERTPSFYIDKENKFKCFGCSARGSVIDLQMILNGQTFIEAVKSLIR
jgi:hypothetical protein